MYFFAWRDIKVRYKQTAIGAAWVIINPVITMVIFTLFFNGVAGIEGGGVPYPIFSYTGLLFWNYFIGAMTNSSSSLISNQGVISKIYFPRIIVPISALLVGLVDLFFASSVFVALMFYYQIVPSLSGLLLVLPMLTLTIVTALGMGLFFSALTVKYRDTRALVGFLTQVLLFITPVIYPVGLVPERFQWLLYLNPMASVTTAMRAGLLHQGSIDPQGMVVSIASAICIFAIGLWYFKRAERDFADII